MSRSYESGTQKTPNLYRGVFLFFLEGNEAAARPDEAAVLDQSGRAFLVSLTLNKIFA